MSSFVLLQQPFRVQIFLLHFFFVSNFIMTVYDAQKDIYAISSSSITFAAIKLYKLSVIKLYKLRFFAQCFDCAAAREQFEIISDTHE